MGIKEEKVNGGEIVAKVLLEHDVQFLFSLCGGHISPVLVGAKNLGIQVIDTRHEANAVFAADAVARISGVPGVAAVTAGPGVTNTITALQNALQAQSPMVLIGGSAPTLLKGRGALQDIDQISLIKPNVKWATVIKQKKDIYPKLHRAFYKAKDGVPGPVFVEIPVDLLYPEEVVREWYQKGSGKSDSLKNRATSWYISRHVNKMFVASEALPEISIREHTYKVDKSKITAVIKAIGHAKRPLLLIGSGAMMQPKKTKYLAQAIEKLNVPIFLSGMARGLLGKENSIQFRHKRRKALKEADLVILAGVPCDFRLDYGKHLGSANYVNLNRSKKDLLKNRRPDIPVLGDPCEFLIKLSQSEELAAAGREEWFGVLQKNETERELEITEKSKKRGAGINPVALFKNLNKQLNKKAVLIADGGDFVGTASYILQPRKPMSWLDPGVFGTLGVGGGFALGAKLCNPDSEVYIIYGDGSSAYSLLEIDTFQRHGLPVISIIGNDGSWNQIARDQLDILNDDVGTVLKKSDYHKIADAFGASGKKVETLSEFNEALKEAKASVANGKSFVINAILAKSDFRKGSLSM